MQAISVAAAGTGSSVARSQPALASSSPRPPLDLVGGSPSRHTTAFFNLTQHFGKALRACPQAKLDDGLLSGTIWRGYTVKDFVFRVGSIYSGDHVKWPGTRCFTARKVVVESGETVLLDIDGEQPGRLPATFDIITLTGWTPA